MQIDLPGFVVVTMNDGETSAACRTASNNWSMDVTDDEARRSNVKFDSRVRVRREPCFLQSEDIDVIVLNQIVYKSCF